jgi:hypothetical protein
VVLEIAGDPNDGLNTAEKLQCILPRVPLFLITQEQSMATEKEALHHEIDAVFKSDDDLTSLVLSPRNLWAG